MKLNKTMQPPVQYAENILKREGDVLTLEGSLSFTNHSDEEMRVMITKEVDGTPLCAGDFATITCTPDYGNNPDGKFLWEMTVVPGETKTVTYQYIQNN